MARPTKDGLDYFPVDIDIDQDDKLIVVIGKFGMLGFGVVIRLLMQIYKNGYFYAWSEREQYAFSNKVNVDINTILEVVNECIKWGFFSQELHDNYKILTSNGIQKRYITATSRRIKTAIKEEYRLIEVTESKNKDNADINEDSDSTMITESTQSKVKESKVKEIKDNMQSSPKDQITKWFNIHRIGGGIGGLDDMFSYIGRVDLDVIERAMLKSIGKHSNYCCTVLNDWIREGKTQIEYHQPFETKNGGKLRRTAAQLAIDREIALNKWVEGGKDPSEFIFTPDP